VLVGHAHRVVADERWLPGEQFEDHAAGGVDVATGVDGLAARLLRRQVLRRSDDRRRLRHRADAAAQRPRDTEVHHLDLAGLGEHDVSGLDVAVDDAVPVAEVERGADVGHDLECPALLQPGLDRQDLFQGSAVHVLHDDVRQFLAGGSMLLAGVVHGHDRRVVQ
jgi:hypothetical protein